MQKRMKTSALLAALLTTTLVLGACASEDKNSGPGSSEVATGGAKFSTADAETAKLGSDAQPGQFPRTVTHSMGETTIEAKPKRVVVLDTGELDDVLALGITPVGMVTTKGENPVPSYLADKVKDVETVGTINELNVEAIAELEPDLIVGSQLRAEKLYPQLSDIAPTVFSIRPGFPWKENFRLVADSLGEEDKATEILNRYTEKVDQIKDKVQPGTTVSMVRFMPEKLRLYANKSLIGVILQDAGLARPEGQDVDELAAEISPEEIAQASADYIFYASYGDPAATGEEQVTQGTAWKNLPAVKDGKAFRVSDDLWYLGLGPIGAEMIVQELQDYLDL